MRNQGLVVSWIKPSIYFKGRSFPLLAALSVLCLLLSVCQVHGAASNNSLSSNSTSLPINPPGLTEETVAEVVKRARNDVEDSRECFIQGPQGLRQSLTKTPSSPSVFLSNDNLTVPIAAVIEGLNEYGDARFKSLNDNNLDSELDLDMDLDADNSFDSPLKVTDRSRSDLPFNEVNSTDSDNNNKTVNLYPCWLDRELARKGQSFARRYFAQINDAHFLSLFLLISNEQVRRVLAYTMKSNNPERARKRYVATLLQVKLWYDEDLNSEHVVKSLLKVRNIHRTVGYRLDTERPDLSQQQIGGNTTTTKSPIVDQETDDTNDSVVVESDSDASTSESPFKPNKYMWEAFSKDLSESYLNQTRGNVSSGRKTGKYAYNQFLMSITQWSFMALPVLYPHKFVGMQEVTTEDLQGFAHLWAVLSYALGMKEEYIICKNVELESCRSYCKKLFDKYFIPFLFELDQEAQILLESLLKVATFIVPQVTEESIMLHLLEDFLGIDCPNLRQFAGWKTHFLRAMYKFQESYMRPEGLFAQFLNFLFRGQIHLSTLKTYGFDGTNPADVAEKAYYFKK